MTEETIGLVVARLKKIENDVRHLRDCIEDMQTTDSRFPKEIISKDGTKLVRISEAPHKGQFLYAIEATING